MMIHNKHAECITMCQAQHGCFTIHIDASCSPETHHTRRTQGHIWVRERGQSISSIGKGPVHIPNRKGASPQGEIIPNCPIPPTHPPTHPIHPKNRGRKKIALGAPCALTLPLDTTMQCGYGPVQALCTARAQRAHGTNTPPMASHHMAESW